MDHYRYPARMPARIIKSDAPDAITADVECRDEYGDRFVVRVTAPLAEDGGIPDFCGITEDHLAHLGYPDVCANDYWSV